MEPVSIQIKDAKAWLSASEPANRLQKKRCIRLRRWCRYPRRRPLCKAGGACGVQPIIAVSGLARPRRCFRRCPALFSRCYRPPFFRRKAIRIRALPRAAPDHAGISAAFAALREPQLAEERGFPRPLPPVCCRFPAEAAKSPPAGRRPTARPLEWTICWSKSVARDEARPEWKSPSPTPRRN